MLRSDFAQGMSRPPLQFQGNWASPMTRMRLIIKGFLLLSFALCPSALAQSAKTAVPRKLESPIYGRLAAKEAPQSAENLSAPDNYPACENQPTENEIIAAKSAYKVGQLSFQEADYQKAILYWEDALTRDCTAFALLLNLARAYELNEQPALAINALSAYLQKESEVKNRAAIEKRIEKLRGKEKGAVPLTQTKATKAPQQSEPVEPNRASRPLAPVLITSAGIVATGVGGLFYGLSRATLKDCNVKDKLCDNDAATDQATGALVLRNTGYILLATGGAAIIAGTLYWTISWNDRDENSALSRSLSPVLVPGYQGVQFSAQF